MNADGTAQMNLTNDPGGDSRPAWSPNGAKIAFDTSRDGNNEIYSMNADGTTQTRLTNNSASDGAPDWQPISAVHQMPASASPLQVPLVVVFKQCGTSGNPVNAQHPGPFWSARAPRRSRARQGPSSNRPRRVL